MAEPRKPRTQRPQTASACHFGLRESYGCSHNPPLRALQLGRQPCEHAGRQIAGPCRACIDCGGISGDCEASQRGCVGAQPVALSAGAGGHQQPHRPPLHRPGCATGQNSAGCKRERLSFPTGRPQPAARTMIHDSPAKGSAGPSVAWNRI